MTNAENVRYWNCVSDCNCAVAVSLEETVDGGDMYYL